MSDVSVVIPTRNRPEIFQRALRSALYQTYSPVEIIVADNSTDLETKKVVESYDDSRIVYLPPVENLIITDNWIRGIEATKCDWVKFIYDDDWIESNFLERTVSYITKDRVMIQTGGTCHMLDTDVDYCTPAVDMNQPAHHLARNFCLGVSPVAALIRRSALEYAIEVMPRLDRVCIEEGIGPDVILLYAATTQIPNSWVHVPEPLGHYDGRYGSLSVRTVQDRPGFLEDCYRKSYDLLDQLHLEAQART